MTTTEVRPIEAGDVFYCSWGYDQTNIDFYEVVRVTKTRAELRPIGSRCVEDNGPTTRVVPDPSVSRSFDVLIETGSCSPYGKPERETKLCTINDRGSVVLKSGRHWARRYEGGSLYETGAGWGH
jgi:hypothetical protein